MAELKDALAYLLQQYPHKAELSNARVTKMVYLGDWRHVLEADRQVSGIRWYFDNYGPFVRDVVDEAQRHPELFRVSRTENAYGNKKVVLACVDPEYVPRLSESERDALDHVIRTTQHLAWDEFIGLVYSTYPVVSSDRYTVLDLHRAAAAYRESPVYQAVEPADLGEPAGR